MKKKKRFREKLIYAKDKKCHRCKKQASVFVGLADPDATQYPMCKDCAEQWKFDVLFEILKQKWNTK